MSLVINTNVASLNAQRSLTASGAELKTAMERLSSGKKINSASDDAAGFAIAERMTAQIRGLNMAAKNANDGLSMLSTIENATNDITGMLHRMRELAVQGINDTNGTQDRAYLQLEVDALMEEINRVASDTQYNGKSVLNGSLANTVSSGAITAYGGQIQVGTDANQTVGFGVNSVAYQLANIDPASDNFKYSFIITFSGAALIINSELAIRKIALTVGSILGSFHVSIKVLLTSLSIFFCSETAVSSKFLKYLTLKLL